MSAAPTNNSNNGSNTSGSIAAALDHRTILASAGSGKTWQLTNRYIQLVLEGAPPPTILATTFTRLAAGEIRDRVLRRLLDAVDADSELQQLAAATGQDQLESATLISALRRMAVTMHRLQIRTLDSFFGSIVQCFGLELGLAEFGSVISEEQAMPLRLRAIRTMLEQGEPEQTIELLRRLTRGDSERSVLQTIDNVVAELYEIHRQTRPGAWDCVPERGKLLAPAALESAIESLLSCPLPKHKKIAEAHGKDIENARNGDWERFLTTGVACAVFNQKATYYSKPLEGELLQIYQPLVDHALAVLVGRIRQQNRATFDLLEQFHIAYSEEKRRTGVLTFNDITHSCLRLMNDIEMQPLQERIDARIQHLLLDEFQDTSITQWQCLLPLIREVISHQPPDATFFCVGDAKQSIYRWRAGEPEVLLNLPDLLKYPDGSRPFEPGTLACSYRSSQSVIDAVNAIFSTLSNNPAIDNWANSATAWQNRYTTHSTARKLAGYAALRILPDQQTQDDTAADSEPKRNNSTINHEDEQEQRANEFAAEQTAKLAAELHAQAPAASIAVLVRSNGMVSRILAQLAVQHPEVEAAGKGGGPLTDSPAVNIMLDALALADHPGDTAAAFNIVHSPLAELLDVGPTLYTRDGRGDREAVARRIRQDLMQRGYAAVLADWVAALTPGCDEPQLLRALRLVDLAEHTPALHQMSPSDFIEVVETTIVADARPAAVQVMTIHQAKGLEFDLVILPDLNEHFSSAKPKPPPVVFRRDGVDGPVAEICRYISSSLRELVPQVKPLFEDYAYRAVSEKFSVLYVAMTRAKYGLYMVIPPPAFNSDGAERMQRTPAGLIRHALCDAAPPPDPDSIAWETGDEQAMFDELNRGRLPDDIDADIDQTGAVGAQTQEKCEPLFASSRDSQQHRRGIRYRGRIATPASMHRHMPLAAELSISTSDAAERGVAMHVLLEQVEWLEDFDQSDAELAAIVRAALPHQSQQWIDQQVAAMRDCVRQPQMARLLSLGDRQPSRVQVFRERPFARLIGGGLQRGAIDRLEVEYNDDDSIRHVQVIDFKTDEAAGDPDQPAGMKYRPQLAVYREVAASMLQCSQERVHCSLAYTTIGTVVEVI